MSYAKEQGCWYCKLIWSIIFVGVPAFWIALAVWLMSGPAEAQDRPFTGPIAEGEWVVPDQGVIVCDIAVLPGHIDPNLCLWVEDSWGPYPTAEMCLHRMQQMAKEFPFIRLQETGRPQWGGHLPECVKKEAPGIDA